MGFNSGFKGLNTQHAMFMRPIVICGLTQLYGIFPHYLIKGGFWKEVFEHKMVCFDFLYNFCLKHFSF